MNSPARFVSSLFVAAWLLVVIAGPAAAGCPVTSVNCNQFSTETGDPDFSTSCEGNTRVEFDVAQATIAFEANLPTVAFNRGGLVWLRDEYTVAGPAPGTPIDLRLRVYANGHAFGAGGSAGPSGFGITFGMLVAGDAVPTRFWLADGGSIAVSDSVDLVLHRIAGQPISLSIEASLGASEGGYADVRFTYRFVDLPPGAIVTSCHGYLQEEPVPALPASWGAVKAAYR